MGMSLTITEFIDRWKDSAGNERANKDSFLIQFCEALALPLPDPKNAASGYCFEKDIKLQHLDGSTSTGSMDLFRAGCFVLEAKQGATKTSGGSAPIRGTRAYDVYMEKAFGQAVRYARELPERPPFVLTCDIGHSFHVWEGFSGTFRGYGARRNFNIQDLKKQEVQDLFRTIWLDPHSLDPSKNRARVTREVAQQLGKLAASLEGKFPSEAVARFLMRCVFTFFAEDTGLLPEKIFENALTGQWKNRPDTFVRGLEGLWDAMNSGEFWGPVKVPRFNGGLFSESLALKLSKEQIVQLSEAAHFDWAEVDPSIFGTLLESALSKEERHKLGAHYTPRAYIERLLRPALEEPLRTDWELVQAEALAILGENPTEADRAKARKVIHAFHAKLATTHVLDPACGSGNFLYVAYDILKRIEQEVFSRLQDLGETRQALALDTVMVTPAQFLGIELKPWAAAIAELVLWIGHLQWYRRQFPGQTPPEPILQRYENIQNRDAVLTWKGTRETGQSRWDGKTFKIHPVTGKEVPDKDAQVPILEYLDPKPAPWPEAEFIVGNPPFLHGPYMRERLGDGYVESLRKTYAELPDGIDFVAYWWHRAASAVRAGRTRRFGLITTNSLGQPKNRRILAPHLNDKKHPLRLLWVVPDHPWTDEGAAVRIAMTVGGLDGPAWLGKVVKEAKGDSPEAEAESITIAGALVDKVHEDLRAGAHVASAVPLQSNLGLTFQGLIPLGEGFLVTPTQWDAWGRPEIVKPYRNGKDITAKPRNRMVIDTFGLDEQEIRTLWPALYQHLFDTVKPYRDKDNRPSRRERWWRFAEPVPLLRQALVGLPRYIVTSMTAKHRVFTFLTGDTLPDQKLIAFALSDAFVLGVLSSRIHGVWASTDGAASTLEDRPVYAHSVCFNPFPFPDATAGQKQAIRDIAERLDDHCKAAQARGVTITSLYNLLAKLRTGETFTAKERDQHALAQTEILRQLHSELDSAVLEAYGWPAGLEDAEILERLVALNRERADEEKRGLIRWLRPEYQAPESLQPAAKPMLEAEPEPESADFKSAAPTPVIKPQPWPKELKEQLSALRSLILSDRRAWKFDDIVASFKSRGAYRDGIARQLELLVDLGIVTKYMDTAGANYYAS